MGRKNGVGSGLFLGMRPVKADSLRHIPLLYNGQSHRY